MAKQVNAEFWKEFIALYKSQPALWNRKAIDYTNKRLKKHSYGILLKKLCELTPNATLETVKRKIHTLRSCYYRELKKVILSENFGSYIYEPTLWYFDNLSFLRNQEAETDDIDDSTFGYDDDTDWEEARVPIVQIEDDQNETFLGRYESVNWTPAAAIDEADQDSALELKNINENLTEPSPKRACRVSGAPMADLATKTRNNRNSVATPEHLAAATTTVSHKQIIRDDASTLSAAWTVLFRKLTPEQQLYANKTIVGVLYQGALGKLDECSYKIFENAHNEL